MIERVISYRFLLHWILVCVLKSGPAILELKKINLSINTKMMTINIKYVVEPTASKRTFSDIHDLSKLLSKLLPNEANFSKWKLIATVPVAVSHPQAFNHHVAL